MSLFNTLPTDEQLALTVENLSKRGFVVTVVGTKVQALEKVKELLPKDTDVHTGSSTTLDQIGAIEWIKNNPHIKYWSPLIWSENDPEKRKEVRRNAVSASYVLGSVNAISMDGQLVAVDGSGSRVGSYLFTAENLIIVSGINKIVPTLDDAFKRVREFVFPKEDERATQIYGRGSSMNKWIIFEGEITPNRVKIVLVKEELGF